ncbi:MAG: tetratricopeptide repeat protein, partial [Planctomycetota bacterium]
MAKDFTSGSKPERLKELLSLGLEESAEQEETQPSSPLDLFIEKPGSRIGCYELKHVLGEGAMAVVYLAQQKQPVKRQVALKIIKPGMDSKAIIARFEAERQALALLDHPNIAHIYDAGTTEDKRPYFAMEYVEGLTITKYCDEHRLPIRERLNLFLKVCQAVHHAHQKGIIHRDIKPSNIIVSIQNGQPVPKVIDFGLAKAISGSLSGRTLVTEHDQLLGTPEYMSPEQADMANEDVDIRSDIYSLGVLLYVLLTGVLPFDFETLRKGGIEHIRKAIRDTDPKTPSTRLTSLGDKSQKVAEGRRTEVATLVRRLHRELEWIPLKAMRKERTERYRSASELADDVENYLRGDPLIAGPPTAAYRLKKFVRRNRAFVTGIAAVSAVLVAGVIISMSFAVRAEHARAEAQAVSDFLRKDVLWSLDLWRTGGQEITTRSVLDAVSEKLKGKFAHKPLVEASIRRELGATYTFLGLYEDAEQQFKRTLEIHQDQLGANHQDTFISIMDVGWVYWWQSRYDEAEQLLTKALEGMELTLDQDNEDRLYCMAILAGVYNYQGRFSEAEQLFGKGWETVCRVLSEENEYSPTFMNGLAFAYHMQGRYNEAEQLFKEALKLSRRVRGEQDMETLSLMINLGNLYHDQACYDEAEQILAKALDGQRHVFGEQHLMTFQAMNSLARLYHRQGRYEEAESLFVNALETSREVLGEEHFATMVCMYGLGELYLSRGRYDEAEALLTDAWDILCSTLGEENWATLRIANTLAKVYEGQ